MENQEFQKQTAERLAKLEKQAFDGTYEENYQNLSARQQSKNISDGGKEYHIGKKSKQVLQQEINAHVQGYRETFSREEEREWYEKKSELIEELREATQ